MRARILLVEDEPDVRLVVEGLLAAERHAAECVADGHEGMRRATTEAFDVLVLDVTLPGPGGREICRAARERGFGGAIMLPRARWTCTSRGCGRRPRTTSTPPRTSRPSAAWATGLTGERPAPPFVISPNIRGA